jgi:drug/metabolite transporter (DMT)-like permease
VNFLNFRRRDSADLPARGQAATGGGVSVRSPLLPFAAASAGIALYSGMDAFMKGLSIASGAYSAVLWRSLAGVVMTGVPFLLSGRRWPRGAALRLHLLRGVTAGASVLLFFWGLARVPMAKGVALTFLAPLLAIFLAAVLLGERVRRAAVAGSVVACLGVAAIAAGEVQAHASATAVLGTIACVAASILDAGSLVLLRQQAQAADPLEVALFTTLVIGVAMLPAAPWLAGWPTTAQVLPIAGAALLGTVSAMLIAWSYARAEAQVVAVTEYTAFVWSALLGWLVFGEAVAGWTVAGAALIIAGCLFALRGRPATEAAA